MPYPADAPPIPASLSYFRYMLNAGHNTRRVSYCAFTLLVWDTLITLDREVQYIWPSRWTVIKCLFLFNRYCAPLMVFLGIWTMTGYATDLSDSFCRGRLLAGAAMSFACLSLATFIMIFRLHAALGSGRSGFVFMLWLWIAGIIGCIATFVELLWKQRRFVYFEDRLTANVCYAVTPLLWPLFLPTIILHVFLLSALLMKVFITPRSSDTAFLRILLADGITYYTVTLAAQLVTVFVWGFLDHSYSGLPFYLMWSINIMAVSRFLLSLKTPATKPGSTISMMMAGSQRTVFTEGTVGHGSEQDHGGTLRQRGGTLEEAPESSNGHSNRPQFTDGDTTDDERPAEKRWIANELITPSLSGHVSHSEGHSNAFHPPPSAWLQGKRSSSFATSNSNASYSNPELATTNALGAAQRERLRTLSTPSSANPLIGHDAPQASTHINMPPRGRRTRRKGRAVEVVHVDAEDSEWWDEDADRGPGVKDSRVGRYDSWL